MDKFDIGELAIVHGVTNPVYARYNQTNCEVTGKLELRLWKDLNRTVLCYAVQLCDGQLANVCPENLKKRPGADKAPDTLATGRETPFWPLIAASKRALAAS